MNNRITQIKTLLLLGLGTLLEWAEFTVYGYSAITLAEHFFPSHTQSIAVLKAFTVFAVGYIMRPLGALCFGRIGDKYGRKPALMGALVLMGVSTFGIGLLPTYAQIGLLAPILLCVFRLLQGMAVSGEFNGAAIFLIEQSKQYKTLSGAWISASAALGMVLGGSCALVFSQTHLPNWAWRIPFLLGGASALIGMLLRRKMNESRDFINQKSKQVERLSLRHLFSHYKKSILYVGLIGAFAGTFVYINNLYIVVYMAQQLNIATATAMQYAICAESLSVISILFFAWIADKSNTRSVLYCGLFLTVLFGPLIFWLIGFEHSIGIMLAMGLFALLNGLTSAPMMKCVYEQFPTMGRYMGVSFSWSIFVALFAGSAPAIAHSLTHYYGINPGWYVSAFALICLIMLPKLDYLNAVQKHHTLLASG